MVSIKLAKDIKQLSLDTFTLEILIFATSFKGQEIKICIFN